MQIPAALFIEQAQERVNTLTSVVISKMIKELHVASPEDADNEQLAFGFILGVVTAQVIKEQTPNASNQTHDEGE